MARQFFNRLTFSCVVTLWLTGCGGRTSDFDDDVVVSSGGTASGGWLAVGGTSRATGGATYYAYGGWGQGGGNTWATGGYNYWATGGYNYWATGGYRATGGYYYNGGKAATGGYRSTGGYPFGAGGKATGGNAGYSGMSGYYNGGGTAGRPPIAGNAGFLRGGSAGASGSGGPAGATATGGKPATGGAPPGAGAAGCPAIGCTTTCPVGYWNSLNGCMSCACVPPDKRLSYDTLSCPADSLTVTVTPQQQTGTWVFKFTWACTATATELGQPLTASVGVTIFNNLTDPITSTNRTITYNPASSIVSIVFSDPQLVVTGSGLPQITLQLTPSSGAYLSIRREGDLFVGGLYLPSTQTGGTTNVMLAGSFSVAVP
jgi:hypothetical protein